MKNCLRFFLISVLAVISVLVGNVSYADTYHTATFTGGIFGGTANVKDPFTSVLTPGGSISGNFVIDDSLIPAPGSGYVNVFFSSFPDSAYIPSATAFTVDLGPSSLTFTFADAIQNSGAIQYYNGQFKGFFFDTDFTFTDGNPYRLDIQGGTWNISRLNEIGGWAVEYKVNGYIGGMTPGDVYAPGPPVATPEPATLFLLGLGVLGVAGIRKFRK